MLKNLDPLLSPDLLHVLRAMGHGDEIAIVDANYPAVSNARRLVRIDGRAATDVLEAVLSLLPLDEFVDCPAYRMEVVDDPDAVPAICDEFQDIINRLEVKDVTLGKIERHAFTIGSRKPSPSSPPARCATTATSFLRRVLFGRSDKPSFGRRLESRFPFFP